ncbi:integral membrane protein, putative [Theileria annulata]|uniref:Integral membrane protein, putative n=1 Tax=Theileria annulata TaxID=5874 RepID=Q4UB10_THEAN|nr:integral membrane protein, putative [Theileria annulata]CAI75991.1 integral membrane protein, putative [Theileria annulata]|eukprot:XP_955467.1 integral membrane protein, putative [Theileria annulata]
MTVTGYKFHVETSRTNRYSSLYHDWFIIGVGCFTYFLVGLSLTLVYVLCEMDYFMLSGLFRIQRFFSDDAYYFSKQVVIMYGVIGFIFTLVIGPIGKMSCMVWSWILTLTYLVFGTCSFLFGFTQYGKLLIISISIISLITHILMCNFIFFLFDPMTNNKQTENKSSDDNNKNSEKSKNSHEANKTKNNDKNDQADLAERDNRSRHLNAIGPYGSLVYYRVIMFLIGFFLGSPIILFVLRVSLSIDTFSEKDPIMSSVDMCRIMMLMFSISVMASIFLTLTFSNASVTEYTLMPFRMISFRRLKKTMFNFFDIELLVVVWIINPLIMTLIPYTTRIHSEFHKFTLFHRLLFSVFLISIMILMHRDILYSCIRTIKLLNASIFNILYTDGYTQINDKDLRETPISTTPYSNYTPRYSGDTPSMVPNQISVPSEVSYPYLKNGWDPVENQDKKLLLRSYQILVSLDRLTHYINTGGDMDIRNIHGDTDLSLCKPQIDTSDESDTNPNDPMKSTVYLLNEYKSELLSMIGSSINRYSNDKLILNYINYFRYFGYLNPVPIIKYSTLTSSFFSFINELKFSIQLFVCSNEADESSINRFNDVECVLSEPSLNNLFELDIVKIDNHFNPLVCLIRAQLLSLINKICKPKIEQILTKIRTMLSVISKLRSKLKMPSNTDLNLFKTYTKLTILSRDTEITKNISTIRNQLSKILQFVYLNDIKNQLSEKKSIDENLQELNEIKTKVGELSKSICEVQPKLTCINTNIRTLLTCKSQVKAVLKNSNNSNGNDIENKISQLNGDSLDISQIKTQVNKLKFKTEFGIKILEQIKSVVKLLKPLKLSIVCVIRSFLESSVESTKKTICNLSNGITVDDSDNMLSDQSLRPAIVLQSISRLSKHINDFIWTLFSHNSLLESKLLISRIYEYIRKSHGILFILESAEYCKCPKCQGFSGFKITNITEVIKSSTSENFTKRDGNHLCLCNVIKHKLYHNLIRCIRYMIHMEFYIQSSISRKFDKHTNSPTMVVDILKLILMIIDFVDELSQFIKRKYLKDYFGDCFCRCSYDPYYPYVISMFLCVSQLMEDVFTFDNEKIQMATHHMSKLIAEYHSMDLYPHKQRLKNSSTSDNQTNSVTSFNIGYEIKISEGSIELNLGLSKVLLSSLEKKCLIIQSFGLITTRQVNTSKFTLFFQKWSEISFSLIKEKQVSSNTKDQIKTITTIISEEYMLTIKKHQSQPSLKCCNENNKCKCCKIICICIRLFSNKLKLIASQLTETGILDFMNSCFKNSELNQLAFDKIRMINTRSESMIKSSRNSRISDSTSSMIYGGDFDHINPKYFGYDDVYRPHPHFGSGYFKFVLSRVLIVIILLFMFIFIRTRFDRFVKPDIFGAYLIKVDSNINRFREVLHNRLGHSIRNIVRIGSLDSLFDDIPDPSHHLVFEYPELADIQDLKSWSESDTISDTFTDAIYDEQSRTVQESRRRKVAFYIVIVVFSLLSSLYLNFVVRDLSVMLNLDHSTWSYFICITILMGMIISLVVKYCVHLYDFVYVLEKYSNRLTKIESFVDDSFGGITGNLSYTSKFIILFQLLRSLKTDIVSLFSMNYPYHIPAQSLMKNKVYPYKDMTSDMERMMTCENIECIRSMVLDTIGTPESMDLQNILDFISYVAMRNTSEFDKYHGYFSGNERYLAWRLGKLLSHNFFLLTYGRYSCILEMDHIIRNLQIPITQFHNCQMLWQLFGNYESNLISLKCLAEESIGVPLTGIQRDVLRNKFNEEYICEFTRYQEFIMTNLHINPTESPDDECSCYFPYPDLIRCPLDIDKVARLTREYFGDTNSRLSLSLPTTNCNVTKQHSNQTTKPSAQSSSVSVIKFCDHWLNMRLGYCDNEECEKAVRFAYELIVSKLSSDSDIFESIKETVANMKLNILNTEEVYETPEDIHLPIKSSEHRSLKDYTNKLNELRYKTTDNYQDTVLDYLNRYMMETMTNTEKIMVPLGIFLSWYGLPICEQHIRNMGKFQYLI